MITPDDNTKWQHKKTTPDGNPDGNPDVIAK
jgi:hypothetical protein